MEQYISKDALVAEIERQISAIDNYPKLTDTLNIQIAVLEGNKVTLTKLLSFINTLEVKDLYEQCVQYDSIKAGIQAHAETYSFNIESELFNQLTKEQQKLWRKEIEQACISGGDAGYTLAKDPRYKENLEVKEVDWDEEFVSLQHIDDDRSRTCIDWGYSPNLYHFDGAWHVSWIHCSEGDTFMDFSGETIGEAVKKASDWFHSTFSNC